MGSREVVEKRRELEKKFQEAANLINGQLTDTRKIYLKEREKLQEECNHIWDNGENAIEEIVGRNVCVICGKKLKY